MKLTTLTKLIPCTVLSQRKGFEDVEIKAIVASDLMSDVLTSSEECFLISTSLNSEQVIRTADIVGAPAVLLVNGKQPQNGMVQLAKEYGVTLLSTPLSNYKVCYIVGCELEKERKGH